MSDEKSKLAPAWAVLLLYSALGTVPVATIGGWVAASGCGGRECDAALGSVLAVAVWVKALLATWVAVAVMWRTGSGDRRLRSLTALLAPPILAALFAVFARV